MTDRIRALSRRLTYANVTATLALFLALGGGAYAAINLPRDSVGSKQLRRGSVGGSELRRGAVRGGDVRNRSLGVVDLSKAARRSLRGQKGDPGPPGLQGPAGPPASAFHAVIAASGDPASGNASGVQHAPGSGEYLVRFPSDVSRCTIVATLGTAGPSEAGQVPPAGRVTVAPESAGVRVRTYDAAGAAAAASFHLAVSC